MFDFFQLFQLIGAVEASSPTFVCWTEAVASLPSAQAFDRDTGKRGNTADAIKIVWYSFGHQYVQVQRVDKNTDIFEFVQIGLEAFSLSKLRGPENAMVIYLSLRIWVFKLGFCINNEPYCG